MTAAHFRGRLQALGCANPTQAAARIGYSAAYVHRMWHGEQPVSEPVQQRLEHVEATQPVKPLTPDMCRVLLTEEQGTVCLPDPRSNFEAATEWGPVLDDMERLCLFKRPPEGLPPWQLSIDGIRAAAWLRERAP